MATSQINGDPVTKQSTHNNGGSTLNGGSTQVLNNVGLGYFNVGVFGTKVIDGNTADKVLDAGVFSYDNKSPIAKRITTELAGGVSNTVLQSGASKPELVRSIHKLEVLRTRKFTSAIRANKYNRYTNEFESGYPQVSVDVLATDAAATPTRSVPGELVYKTGAPVPVMDTYKSKTN